MSALNTIRGRGRQAWRQVTGRPLGYLSAAWERMPMREKRSVTILGIARLRRREGVSPLTGSPRWPSTPARQSRASRCLDPRASRAPMSRSHSEQKSLRTGP